MVNAINSFRERGMGRYFFLLVLHSYVLILIYANLITLCFLSAVCKAGCHPVHGKCEVPEVCK